MTPITTLLTALVLVPASGSHVAFLTADFAHAVFGMNELLPATTVAATAAGVLERFLHVLAGTTIVPLPPTLLRRVSEINPGTWHTHRKNCVQS